MSRHLPATLPYWLVFGFGLLVANLAYFLPAPFGWPLTLGFFLFAPGYLSLQFIARQAWSRWETLSFSLGLSILFLMLTGLALNALGYAGLDPPLKPLWIFIALDIAILPLLFANRRTRIPLRINKSELRISWRRALGSLLLLLPLVAAGGALRLNNDASNSFTLVLFAVIAVLFVVLMLRARTMQRYYPMALFLFAFSLLLSVSLRGWDITGHDIQREFNVFQLTMQYGMWDIAAFRDPYNACLSITLLPAMLAHMTGIPDAYIFKVVFQFIAAFAVIPAYFFVRRLHGPRDALLAGFIFLLFPTFLNDMAMLNRQEIAFLFFGLIMLLMLLTVSYRRMQILTVLLLIGLTLSHYSSSYIMIGLMLAAWCVNFLAARLTRPKFASENINAFPIMTLPIIVFAGIFVFTWNDQITQTTRGLNATISKTFSGLSDDSKQQASDVGYSLFGGEQLSPQEILNEHTKDETGDEVKLTVVDQPTLPATSLGNLLGGSETLETIHGFIRGSIAKLLQVLIIIGCVILWWRIKQHRHGKYDLYVLSLCAGSTLLLAALTVLPQLSVDYGVLRLFQQLLFILALPIIAALVWLGSFLTKRISTIYASSAVFLALIFLHTSGFIPQVTGGYAPQLSLNNSGFYYDAYYVTADERRSAAWLSMQADEKKYPGSSAAVDAYGLLRLPDNQNVAITSPYTPSTRAYTYHYKHPKSFIINVNSNLYYYTIERSNAREDILYAGETSHVGKLTEASL